MRPDVAQPALFRASAVAADGVPWLAAGFHLRVRLSPLVGFPLHPFAAWRLEHGHDAGEPPIRWRDAAGNSLAVPFDLERVGGFAEGSLFGVSAANPYVWIEVDVDNRGLRLDLLDTAETAGGGAHVIATRRREPFRFGHTGVVRLRASGAGTIGTTRALPRSVLAIEQVIEREPDLTFGLPLAAGYWYAPGPNDPLAAAKERVGLAAPRRLSPPDNPTGALPDDTDPGDETARIMDRIAPELVDPWLARGWSDRDLSPVHATFSDTAPAPGNQPVTASAAVTPSLLTMAVDPQIARYLGLVTAVPFGATRPVERANVWVIASRWAIQRGRAVLRPSGARPLTLDDVLGRRSQLAGRLDGLLHSVFPDARDLLADLPGRPGDRESGPWSSVPLVAVAVAAGDAPPDPPDPFQLTAAEPGAWNPQGEPGRTGGESWRQRISLGARPAPGMVGFARMAPSGPVALHRLEPPPGQGYVTRALPLVPNRASDDSHSRVLEDRAVPAGPAGASWRVWVADEFGQWSGGSDLALPSPDRPAPPPPVVEATFHADPDDGTSGPRVPGTLHLRYAVPDPAHASPGGLPVTELRVSVDGVALPPRPVTPGDTVVLEPAPNPFEVGEQRGVQVVSTYRDAAGTASVPSTTDCAAYDARAPRAIPTSPMLLWTGQRDATGQAELALRWPPRPGAARYRIYLGDARRLAGELGISLADTPVRAAQAKVIHPASANLTAKGAFTFLGEITGTPAGDGFVPFATRIPGGLRGVQLVRVVPLTAGGAEAAFQTCGLVPVAVPSIDRPPPPLLDAVTDPAGGLTLTVRARGLRPEPLAAAPGGAPEYRLRRTRRGLARHFAPVWTSGNLTGPDADGGWTATVTVPAAELIPFVRTVWYAEARYPAEPALPPGTVALPADGGVEPVWSAVGDSSEGLWSEPSLAAESLPIPPADPAPPPAPAVTATADGSIELTLSGLPTAHPTASTPYHLEIYRGTPGTASERRAVVAVLDPDLAWTDPAPIPAGAHYDLVVVDPIGRRGPATRA
ncbi:hypothetical protein [Frankia sp. QA3]|uniref:hypothetical protein n=1 Tax=Frankia sp. QA3 TaxID=710111 RepID=UPI000269BC7C|nr:hypothetical protein [Frankia sp. QA3]EIV92690.1 hypothetical protein FraQA3DRAFT_2299 [Frankia sp. QA3]